MGADSYTAMKRIACNKSRWKAANQSKDRRNMRRKKKKKKKKKKKNKKKKKKKKKT
jgi:hypothetical protein